MSNRLSWERRDIMERLRRIGEDMERLERINADKRKRLEPENWTGYAAMQQTADTYVRLLGGKGSSVQFSPR